MNKDAILATIIGFGIGLVITGAVLAGPGMLKGIQRPQLTNITQKEPTPTQVPQAATTMLTITTPLSESILQKNETVVAGTTSPNALVVLAGENTEVVTTADAQGSFTGTMALVEGKNTMIATSYTEGKPQTQSIIVFYTPEKF